MGAGTVVKHRIRKLFAGVYFALGILPAGIAKKNLRKFEEGKFAPSGSEVFFLGLRRVNYARARAVFCVATPSAEVAHSLTRGLHPCGRPASPRGEGGLSESGDIRRIAADRG